MSKHTPDANAKAHASLLLASVEIDGRRADVRVHGSHIREIAPRLTPAHHEHVIDAAGGALLPGLHDHHIHVHALAARRRSLSCGPPAVQDAHGLRTALAGAEPGPDGWVRGIDYHESVAGELARAHLDALVGHVPVRLQHRGGKLWMLNSAAIERIALQRWAGLDGVECDAAGRVTGRLFRLDDWLQERLRDCGDAPAFPDLARVSQELARCGVTGVTDTSAHNDARHLDAFIAAVNAGQWRQRLTMMGTEALPAVQHARITRGQLKVLLDDDALPDIDELAARISAAHAGGRAVAFHCVTRIELLFALAALAQAGRAAGDRIEHAGIVPDDALPLLRASGACVVTQPNFIAERGDHYRKDVAMEDQPLLYRLASLLHAGIQVGGGTDAPYGTPDPWASMRAAVHRRCASGESLGPQEAVSPERALALFITDAMRPGGSPRRLTEGAIADLCLLDRPWQSARSRLRAEDVAATIVDGEIIHRRA